MRTRISSLTFAALFGVYLVGRLIIVARGKVFTSFDTFSYAYRDDPAWDRGALVSFVGDAPRPWGVPLFFVAFPDDHSRAVGQWVVGTLAWALLAWAGSSFMRHRVSKFATAAAILLVGLLRQVASWDFAILSESLSISLGVLTLALFLCWMRAGSLWLLAAMTIVAVWWIFTRVDMFVMAAPVGAALVLHAWRQRKSAPQARNAALAAALVLALAAGWSFLVVGPASLQTHKRWSFAPQLSHERGLLMYRLRISVFPDPEVKAMFETKLGMPKCPAADSFVATTDAWAVDKFAAEVDKCPELRVWAEKNQHGLWNRYAMAAPGVFIGQIGQLTSQSLAGAGAAYGGTPSVVPAPLEKAAFPRTQALALTVVALLLALALALVSRGRRRQPQLFWTGAVIAATALASAVLTVIVSAGEVWRFGIQEAIAVRIAIAILLGVALDAFLSRRETPPPEPVTSRR